MARIVRVLFVLLGILLIWGAFVVTTGPHPDLSLQPAPLALSTPVATLEAATTPTPVHLVRRGSGSIAFLIPDSELVYSPAYEHFDFPGTAQHYDGPLAHYFEPVEGTLMSGPQIIQLVAERFSVGPRVLLTLLEMREGWLTGAPGYNGSGRGALFEESNQIASALDQGDYGKVLGWLTGVTLRNGTHLPLDPSLNPGTAALYNFLAQESGPDTWPGRIGPAGFSATYRRLFGDPFANAIDPLIADDVKQPTLRLPWKDGETWFFTGGPHGGWTNSSGRAAIDLAPPDADSCRPSADWALAAAPGRVVGSEHGRVMVNISGGDFQGAGWTLMYMHTDLIGQPVVGMSVKTGDPIGHPSCEGGIATGSHLHLARLYNGQWIPADDRTRPLVLAGWVVNSFPNEYDGTMIRGPEWRIASTGHAPSFNGITADEGPSALAGN